MRRVMVACCAALLAAMCLGCAQCGARTPRQTPVQTAAGTQVKRMERARVELVGDWKDSPLGKHSYAYRPQAGAPEVVFSMDTMEIHEDLDAQTAILAICSGSEQAEGVTILSQRPYSLDGRQGREIVYLMELDDYFAYRITERILPEGRTLYLFDWWVGCNRDEPEPEEHLAVFDAVLQTLQFEGEGA